jgi:anti-anti-sigma factor
MDNDVASSGLGVRTWHAPDRMVIELAGVLDFNAADRLVALVNDALVGRPPHLELDAGQLSYLDSAGLKALLAARAATQDAGGDFRLSGASPPVSQVIDMAGLGDLLLG